MERLTLTDVEKEDLRPIADDQSGVSHSEFILDLIYLKAEVNAVSQMSQQAKQMELIARIPPRFKPTAQEVVALSFLFGLFNPCPKSYDLPC